MDQILSVVTRRNDSVVMCDYDYKVTIAVPVYEVESYIEKCAISLFEQTYPNLEIIFINDRTPDNSIGVVERVLDKYPNRQAQVRIVNQPERKGCPAARNLAVQLSTGDFLFHVDADDFIEKDAISSLVSEQKATDADLVVAKYAIETQDATGIVKYCDISKTKEEIVKDCLADKSSQSVWGILIRRQLYIDHNIKADERFHVGEDWQVSPLLLYYSEKIAYIDKIVYHYQLSRPNSITMTSQVSVSKKKDQLVCFVKTMNCLLDSFQDKGETYVSVIYRKKAILVQDAMIYCCKDRDKKTFRALRRELDSIDDRYLTALGGTNPVVRMLKKGYYSLWLLLCLRNKRGKSMTV